jgi:aspartate carbamoyltransferase
LKELLGIKQLSAEEIYEILDLAAEMKKYVLKGERRSLLTGRRVTTLFYENSTRTKTSFELAASLAGASVNSLDISTSSVQKGESLVDTGKTLDALRTDIVVIRHQISGAPLFLSKNIKAAVINAGDGAHEHPTQALLDFFTMRERFGTLRGLKVAIIGDVKHSRVARSNLWGLLKLGAYVTLCAPKTLLPVGFDSFCRVTDNPREAVAGADVVMGLRIQLERQKQGLFPSLREYNSLWGIDEELLSLAGPDAVVMHPGPVNRGVEIGSGVLDGEKSLVLEQVTNGVAVRMAVLSLIGKELQEV